MPGNLNMGREGDLGRRPNNRLILDLQLCHSETRELLTFVLSSQGFDVVATGTQYEARSLAQTSRFDLYLIDSRKR